MMKKIHWLTLISTMALVIPGFATAVVDASNPPPLSTPVVKKSFLETRHLPDGKEIKVLKNSRVHVYFFKMREGRWRGLMPLSKGGYDSFQQLKSHGITIHGVSNVWSFHKDPAGQLILDKGLKKPDEIYFAVLSDLKEKDIDLTGKAYERFDLASTKDGKDAPVDEAWLEEKQKADPSMSRFLVRSVSEPASTSTAPQWAPVERSFAVPSTTAPVPVERTLSVAPEKVEDVNRQMTNQQATACLESSSCMASLGNVLWATLNN